MPLPLLLLFFPPVLNLLLFAILSFIPSRRILIAAPASENSESSPSIELDYARHRETRTLTAYERWMPASSAASFWLAATLSAIAGIVLTLIGVSVFKNYGWGLFFGGPFAVGLAAAVLHGLRTPRSMKASLLVAFAAIVLGGVGMIVVAIEGLGCLIMLAPLAIPLALIGGAAGCAIQSRIHPSTDGLGATLLVLTLLPMMMGAEKIGRDAPRMIAVTTAVDIDAPLSVVWRNVVAFDEIAPPGDWIFRAGVADPVRARIEGTGVGATRYCEFSTGAFVEPITVWNENQLLKFDVSANPPPMREWSPFGIHPPHLNGFLVSHGGQFQLTELPNGRTRLEGTTWYKHGMWPAVYWQAWSDYIIHRIHTRVLEHIQQLSETPPALS